MRIVLVEPSRAVQRIMTQLIDGDQHDVLAFNDAHKALACITSEKDVRALITSTQLDNMSGVQLCAAARKLVGSHRALYIILMSSTDDRQLVIEALDNGADDFIRKPPVSEELRARLRTAERVTSMQQELILHATTDFLTGLLNRRAFFDRAARACRAAEAQERAAAAAAIFDVDHFKRVNDSYGHDAGDMVLAAVGRRANLLDGIAGRLGGEEFGLLMHRELAGAVELADDLRRAIRDLRFSSERGPFGVTCSFGVAQWEKGDTIDRVLRRADLALYEAKDSGRDRVTAANSLAVTEGHELWRGVTRSDQR